jgi:putative transposase
VGCVIQKSRWAFFFTLTLADRGTDLLVRHIERLRRAYAEMQKRLSFATAAICVLPDQMRPGYFFS